MEQLRLLGLVVAVLGMAVILYIGWRHRSRAWYILPAVLYLGHLGVFYAVRVLQFNAFLGFPLTPESVNLWSVTIHIQAAITIIAKALMMISDDLTGVMHNA